MKDLKPDTADRSELITFRGFTTMLGLDTSRNSRLFLWRAARHGRCPAPLKLGTKVFWRRAEVEAWLAKLPKAKYAAEGA